jgi:hypothetical protein
MRKTLAVVIAAITVGIWLVPGLAQAQEGSKESNPGPAKLKPLESYRLDFSFNEVADGKIVNTRHYSMNLTAGNSDEIKIGTRVPVPSEKTSAGPGSPERDTQFQYIDVGTNIWSQLREHGDELMLVVRSEVSNLDVDSVGSGSLPVVRQIKISGDTLLVVGKPIMIGSADDPNSKRQFQLEVTVTKLK